jgi:hypothetical protein
MLDDVARFRLNWMTAFSPSHRVAP